MLKNATFVESCLTNTKGKKAQHGYDVTLKGVKKVGTGGAVMCDKSKTPHYESVPAVEGCFVLCKGVYSITFNEGGEIPKNSSGFFKHRSSVARCGGEIYSGWYDTGFCCENFGAILVVHVDSISIEHNARVAQLLLFASDEASTYDGQWQGEKDVK